MKRKSKKKKRSGKILFLIILIGIIGSIFYLFRQEIFNSLKPWLEKWEILEKRKEIVLYFSDSNGEYLIGEKREILKKNDVKEEAKETIIELIKGPKGKLTPTLPPKTKLLAIQLNEEGVAKVNFNKSLSKDHPGGSSAEIMTTYSIVNSLTLNFPKIKQVQILVEGKPIETIAGHLSLKQPISSNPSLIKRQ
jgi:spore germination protein GerM